MKQRAIEFKVGLFAAIVISLLVWGTLRVSDKTTVGHSGYILNATFDNATGLKLKAPVELAGVKVGIVKAIELIQSKHALVSIALNGNVVLPGDSQAILKSRGFLGETYVEIVPGIQSESKLAAGESIVYTERSGDMNALISRFNSIAGDIKQMTSSMKEMVGNDQSYPVNRIVDNLDTFTKVLKDVSLRNQDNINQITENMAMLSNNLNMLIAKGRTDVEDSLSHLSSITQKIDNGQGTVGRLINDDETVNKLNRAVDTLNETLGGFNKLETEIGYHTEYLTQSEDFKHHVSVAFRPSPDKALLIGLTTDPDPRPSHIERVTSVTINNNTTEVSSDTATTDRNQMRFSAQLAKSFYDFTVRGGIIESSGGIGLDYNRGPLGVHVSAFDFSTRFGQRPHIKLSADWRVTPNIYVIGGADDLIDNIGPNPDWFVGAGFRFVDEDVKRLLTLGGASMFKK